MASSTTGFQPQGHVRHERHSTRYSAETKELKEYPCVNAT